MCAGQGGAGGRTYLQLDHAQGAGREHWWGSMTVVVVAAAVVWGAGEGAGESRDAERFCAGVAGTRRSTRGAVSVPTHRPYTPCKRIYTPQCRTKQPALRDLNCARQTRRVIWTLPLPGRVGNG